QVDGALAQLGDAAAGVGQVRGGDDRFDAGQAEGLFDADAADKGVGVGAAQDAAGEQAGQLDVGTVNGPAGDLVEAIVADGTGADDLVPGFHPVVPVTERE